MTEKFVTLPREVLERALAAMSLVLSDVDWRKGSPTQPVIHKAYNSTSAALDQPQPKRKPLTDDEIDKLCPQFDDPMRREMWIIGFKAAHNIK